MFPTRTPLGQRDTDPAKSTQVVPEQRLAATSKSLTAQAVERIPQMGCSFRVLV